MIEIRSSRWDLNGYLQLMKRLCPLVVKPRVHLTRFFGCLAPNSKWRKLVVPRPPDPPEPESAPTGTQLKLPATEGVPRNPPVRPRLDWAQLLRRTWGFDVFDCPCGGRRRILALVTHPDYPESLIIPRELVLTAAADEKRDLNAHRAQDNDDGQSESRNARTLGVTRHRGEGCRSSPACFQKASSTERFICKLLLTYRFVVATLTWPR